MNMPFSSSKKTSCRCRNTHSHNGSFYFFAPEVEGAVFDARGFVCSLPYTFVDGEPEKRKTDHFGQNVRAVQPYYWSV